jgi:aminopeptidase N
VRICIFLYLFRVLSSKHKGLGRKAIFLWWLGGCMLLPAGGQGLAHYSFENSRMAARESPRIHSLNTLNENPRLEEYDVKFYGLDVEVDNRSDRINGNTTILVEAQVNSFDTLVFELHPGLMVGKVLVDGLETSFTHTDSELYIYPGTPVDSGTLLSAQVFYGGETGEGMVRELDPDWGAPVTFTLSEPFYAKDWFPCKENLGDKADSVHVFITTDYGLMGVSQGLHTATTYFPNGKVRYEWKSNYPIAFYLISVAVADYREYNLEVQPQGIQTPILIQNFVYDLPGCLEQYRDQIGVTLPIMELYCDLFGPYPFREEKYGHYLWPWGGGMEHQTMTGMGHFEFYLIAHELGHSWFGDYVTCATWQDIWINEGFATLAGYLATEILAPEYADGEREYRFNRALLEPDGSVYVPDEDKDNDGRIFSGNLSYNKGMALLHMIRFELQDDDLFFLTLRNFLDRYANDVATGLDFKEVLEETSGMDFSDFFDQWYFGAGYPIYQVSWEQQDELVTLHATQTTSSARTPLFRMSMEYRINYEGGDTLVRVFHGSSGESYQFNIPHPVTGVVIDPRNQVLDGVPETKKSTRDEALLFSLGPNPNRGIFVFRMHDSETVQPEDQVTLEIYSASGQLVQRESYRGMLPYLDYRVHMDHPVPGLYYARFRCGKHIETLKIMVE